MNELSLPDIQSGIRLKQGVLETPEGEVIPIGGPFIDQVCKIHFAGTESSELTRHVRIQSILIIDGISIRKLKVDNVRTALTHRHRGKVSLKPDELGDHARGAGTEFTETALKVTGLGVIADVGALLQKSARRVTGVMRSTPDDTRVFRGKMHRGKTPIGKVKTSVRKYNAPDLLPKDLADFEDISNYATLPLVYIDTSLVFNEIPSGRFSMRSNIPLVGLNRDHARTSEAHSFSRTSIGKNGENFQDDRSGIDLGKYKFIKLTSSDE